MQDRIRIVLQSAYQQGLLQSNVTLYVDGSGPNIVMPKELLEIKFCYLACVVQVLCSRMTEVMRLDGGMKVTQASE